MKARQSAINDKRQETRAEFESRLKAELQEILSAKMQKLLDRQTEATKVTADAARTLAQLQMSKRPHEPLAATADPIPIAQLAEALRRTAVAAAPDGAAANSDESAAAASRSSKVTNADREQQRSTTSGDRSSVGRPLSRELQSLISETESRVPSVLSAIEHTEASGGSVPKTIAEVIHTLSASSLSASQNISEDVAAELTEEQANTAGTGPGSREAYTSKFEDAEDEDSSTVRELSSAAISASEKSNWKSERSKETAPEQPETLPETGEEEEEPGYESTSESRLLAPSTSTLSLFSDGDSFNKFTLQMFRQHLEDESVRARHQYDLLKKKEVSLITKAKRELEALQERKKAAGVSDEERQRAKRRAKLILAELKSRRAEIDHLKKSLKVAEKERRMIMVQQKRMMSGEGGNAGAGGSSSSSTSWEDRSRSASARSKSKERTPERERSQATRDAIRSAEQRTSEWSKRPGGGGGEQGQKFLETGGGKDLERLLRRSKARAAADSGSESSSVQEEGKSESEKTSTTTTAPTSPSKMQNLKKAMGAPLKTPLSPKATSGGGGGGGRRRHSSADSDDSQSVSHSETVSDHSDVEIRINALQDELRRRMMTAAKLKKQQRAKSKEKLRVKEETLRRQIEKYDKLIQETVAELEEEPAVVQPQIKTPYKAAAAAAAAPAGTSSATTSLLKKSFEAAAGELSSPRTSPGADGVALTRGGGGSSGGSSGGQASSHYSSAAIDTIYSKAAKTAQHGDHLKVGGLVEAALATASPTKVSSGKTSEDDDAVQSDLNYSDDFTSSNGSGAEAAAAVAPMKKREGTAASSRPVTALAPTTPKGVAEVKSPAAVGDAGKAEERKLAQADRIASGILEQLLAETIDFCVSEPKRDGGPAAGVGAKPSLSPRSSRPQDLMLTTFDISSESSDEGTDLTYERRLKTELQEMLSAFNSI